MSNVFEFVASQRSLLGKNAARAERRKGQVPAVVYGGESNPQSIVLEHNEVLKHLEHEAVYSHVLDLKIDGKTEKAVLKGVQRHPAKPAVLHLDFMRVAADHKLKVHVPLHFINEEKCVGAKAGGVITHAMVDIEVSCLPDSLPEFIEVDLLNLNVGESLHLSDLVLPAGVEVVALSQGADHNHTVAQVIKTRGGQDASGSEDESAS